MANRSTDPRRPPIPLFRGALGGVPRLTGDLPMPLVVLVDRFNVTMRSYADGQLSKAEAGAELARLRHTDDRGMTWTIGPSSGRWYARRGTNGPWELADPATGRFLGPDRAADTPGGGSAPDRGGPETTAPDASVDGDTGADA